MRRSGVNSGWKAEARIGPWRTRTGAPSCSASTSTAGPVDTHQGRPDEDGRAVPDPRPNRSTSSVSNDWELAAVAVAPDDGVEHAEGPLVGSPVEHLLGHEHQAGAGPEDGQGVGRQALDQRVEESGGLEQHGERRRLAARQNQAVHPVEFAPAA